MNFQKQSRETVIIFYPFIPIARSFFLKIFWDGLWCTSWMDRALMLGLGLQDTAPGKALDDQIPYATLSTTRGAHPRKQKHKEDQVQMLQIHVSDLILTLTHSFSFFFLQAHVV